MVHPGGRPRTSSPPPAECVLLGKEYISWLKLNPTAVHHTEWYSIEKDILTSDWDNIILTKEFSPYYEKAKHILAARHMKGVIKEGLSHRFISMYLSDLRNHEKEKKREEIDYEYEKKFLQEQSKNIPPNDADLTDKINLINENKRLKEEIDALKSKTNDFLSGGQFSS